MRSKTLLTYQPNRTKVAPGSHEDHTSTSSCLRSIFAAISPRQFSIDTFTKSQHCINHHRSMLGRNAQIAGSSSRPRAYADPSIRSFRLIQQPVISESSSYRSLRSLCPRVSLIRCARLVAAWLEGPKKWRKGHPVFARAAGGSVRRARGGARRPEPPARLGRSRRASGLRAAYPGGAPGPVPSKRRDRACA